MSAQQTAMPQGIIPRAGEREALLLYDITCRARLCDREESDVVTELHPLSALELHSAVRDFLTPIIRGQHARPVHELRGILNLMPRYHPHARGTNRQFSRRGW